MISIFLSVYILSFLTVAVHATGIAVLVRGLIRHHPPTTYCRGFEVGLA
jgi:hypothetical protein